MNAMELLKKTGMLATMEAELEKVYETIRDNNDLLSIKQETEVLLQRLCKRMDEIYSQEEYKELVEFYDSPFGKKLLEKGPLQLRAISEEAQSYNFRVQLALDHNAKLRSMAYRQTQVVLD